MRCKSDRISTVDLLSGDNDVNCSPGQAGYRVYQEFQAFVPASGTEKDTDATIISDAQPSPGGLASTGRFADIRSPRDEGRMLDQPQFFRPGTNASRMDNYLGIMDYGSNSLVTEDPALNASNNAASPLGQALLVPPLYPNITRYPT